MGDIFISNNGISMDIFPRYQNRDIRPTKSAADELLHAKKGLWNVLEILESGYNCSSSRRKANILERCLRKGEDVYKAVVADCGEYWLLIHFGRFTYKLR